MSDENIKLDTHIDDIINIPMSITKYEMFLAHGPVGEHARALYMHLLYTGIRQQTNQVWANRAYIKKGLYWGQLKYQTALNLLIKLKLVEIIQTTNNGNIKGKKYIKVITRTPLSTKNRTVQKNDTMINHKWKTRVVDSSQTNSSQTNLGQLSALGKKENALGKKQEEEKKIPLPSQTKNKEKETPVVDSYHNMTKAELYALIPLRVGERKAAYVSFVTEKYKAALTRGSYVSQIHRTNLFKKILRESANDDFQGFLQDAKEKEKKAAARRKSDAEDKRLQDLKDKWGSCPACSTHFFSCTIKLGRCECGLKIADFGNEKLVAEFHDNQVTNHGTAMQMMEKLKSKVLP
jgi:hypothetical protein